MNDLQLVQTLYFLLILLYDGYHQTSFYDILTYLSIVYDATFYAWIDFLKKGKH